MTVALLVLAALLIVLFLGGQGDGRMVLLSCVGGLLALVLWTLAEGHLR